MSNFSWDQWFVVLSLTIATGALIIAFLLVVFEVV
jgi:hypothetical protein